MLLSINHLRSQADRLVGARDVARRQLGETARAIKELEDEGELLELVQGALRTLLDKEVSEGVAPVEKLLTEGLQAVFYDQKIHVESEVGLSRGKVSVDLITVQERLDGVVIKGTSNDAFGGAVSTLQSVMLRVIVAKRRGLRPLVLLDETLPAVDGSYVDSMGKFLQLVCSRLSFDLLLVTFNPALIDSADRGYRIARTKGGARLEVLR